MLNILRNSKNLHNISYKIRLMSNKTHFENLPERPNFVGEERRILEFWNKIGAFKKQLEKSKKYPEFTFYDGPPFATGLPHYGHICAGTIKDVICRYATMTGNHVERNWGWDCHGVPIEMLVNQELGLKDMKAVYEYGVKNYDDYCRTKVLTYADEWEKTMSRTARWIDYQNCYKTMDLDYMQSVWWLFKQIFEKK